MPAGAGGRSGYRSVSDGLGDFTGGLLGTTPEQRYANEVAQARASQASDIGRGNYDIATEGLRRPTPSDYLQEYRPYSGKAYDLLLEEIGAQDKYAGWGSSPHARLEQKGVQGQQNLARREGRQQLEDSWNQHPYTGADMPGVQKPGLKLSDETLNWDAHRPEQGTSFGGGVKPGTGKKIGGGILDGLKFMGREIIAPGSGMAQVIERRRDDEIGQAADIYGNVADFGGSAGFSTGRNERRREEREAEEAAAREAEAASDEEDEQSEEEKNEEENEKLWSKYLEGS